jgi:hypothetical protein
LDPVTEGVLVVATWVVAVFETAGELVLPVGGLEAAGLAVVEEVVLGVPVFAVVVEVLVPAVVFAVPVLAVPVLAVVEEVFWVVEGFVGVCGESCASRIAAETKLQTRIMIERFIVHPFDDIEGVRYQVRRGNSRHAF